MDPEKRRFIEGTAARAIGMCEMGTPDNDVFVAVGEQMLRLGILTKTDALLVAEAIGSFPQPDDDDAYERERRRPIEEALGVTSPEDELAALMRAREILQRVADSL